MWEYVKGSEADFEGAPEWATHITVCINSTGKIAVENFDYMSRAIRLFDKFESRVLNPTSHTVIAERRKVDNLQSRVNDANLQQHIRIGSGVAPGLHSGPVYELIAERGTRYGEFKDGAAIMQQLKDVMKGAPKWEALKPSQKEALEMIQHKIGRILNGDPHYDDNWKDIAGYATLIVKELSK